MTRVRRRAPNLSRAHLSARRWFKSRLLSHKRNVFCLPRQKAFFLAFYGKIRSKSHKIKHIGIRDGHHGCPEARFFVSGTENSPKMLVYFLRFFALQRSRQSTARGDLNLRIQEGFTLLESSLEYLLLPPSMYLTAPLLPRSCSLQQAPPASGF